MRRRIVGIVWVSLFCLVAFSRVLAQEGIQVVQAHGRASIKEGDVAMARDEALIDARKKAVEKAFGIEVDSETIISQERMVDHTVVNSTRGYIRDYRILNEFQQSGMYYVDIEAWVTAEMSSEEVKRLLRNFTTVVGFTTEEDGFTVEDERAESLLTEKFVDSDFQVLEKAHILLTKGTQTFFRAFTGSVDAAQDIGIRYLANVVVIGKIEGKFSSSTLVSTYSKSKGQIICYRAHIRIRAYETDTGRIIVQVSTPFEGIKGFGSNKARAKEDAFAGALSKMIDTFMQKMSKYTRDKLRPVTVLIRGIPSMAKFRMMKDLLKNMRWVQDVRDKGFVAGGTSEFNLKYPEKIYIMATNLDRLTILDVKEKAWNNIKADYVQ